MLNENEKRNKIQRGKKVMNIEQEYTDIKKAGSFSGAISFFKHLKNRNKNIKYNDVIKHLKEIDTYTLFKSRNKKFKRSKIIVPGLNHTFQIDLCDMRSLAKENDGFQYILTMIDVFSKKAWAVAMKNKTCKTVLDVINQIITKKHLNIYMLTKETNFLTKMLKIFYQNTI